VFTPAAPAAPAYSTEDDAAVAGDAFALQIATQIDGLRASRGLPALRRDGRLDRVAFDVLRATGPCRAPSADLVAFLLWRQGIVEPEPNLFLHCGDEGAEPTALATMRSQLASATGWVDWRRLGIAVHRAPGRWQAAIVFQEKNLEMEPLPRNLAVGGRAVVAGWVRAGLAEPEVLVTPPRGAVLRPATTVKRSGFGARIDCLQGSGIYQVEITAQDERGPRVVANFPVFCGVDAPASFVLPEPAVATTLDPALVERQLLDLVDRDRAKAGLPPLVRDARLAAVARSYSREMAETGDVAHVSPRTGSVVDRVRTAGVAPPPTTLAENVASAVSAAEAEQGFMGSPGHRDNLLNRSVTHVGVGVAVGRAEGPTVPLYFTQIFAGWQE
jgi:uncharacterized protein YkwD